MKRLGIAAIAFLIMLVSGAHNTIAYTKDYSSYQREKQRNYDNYQRQKEQSYKNNRNKSYSERRADYERIVQENKRVYEDTYNKYHNDYSSSGNYSTTVNLQSTDASVSAQSGTNETVMTNASLPVVDYVMVSADKVNVREQPSIKSKSLGKANNGLMLARFENRTDGWSGVYYNNRIAYIKTEFLVNSLTGLPAGQ